MQIEVSFKCLYRWEAVSLERTLESAVLLGSAVWWECAVPLGSMFGHLWANSKRRSASQHRLIQRKAGNKAGNKAAIQYLKSSSPISVTQSHKESKVREPAPYLQSSSPIPLHSQPEQRHKHA